MSLEKVIVVLRALIMVLVKKNILNPVTGDSLIEILKKDKKG